jgi:photosystem II stability/assembly factor-like uncharacterized protein
MWLMKKSMLLVWLLMFGPGMLEAGKPWQLTGKWQQVPLRTKAMKDAGLFGGEGGQCVYDIKYAPSDPSRVYLVIDCSQVWRSDNGGDFWRCVPNGFHSNGGIGLSVDPENKDVVFVAASTGNNKHFSSPKADGIYRTLDGGKRWERVFKTQYHKCKPKFNHGNYFYFLPESFNGKRYMTIYAATMDSGVLESTDGGDAWKCIIAPVEFGTGRGRVIKDMKANPNSKEPEFWICSENGLFIARKSGNIFKLGKVDLSAKGLPVKPDNYPTQIYFNPKNKQIVYAVCGYKGFYKSSDGGKNFTPKNKGLKYVEDGKKRLIGLSMSHANPDWLTVMFECYQVRGNFMSRDGGETWKSFTGMDQGGLRKESWFVSNADAANYFAAPRCVGFHPQNPNIAIVAGRRWGLERTTDMGKTWTFSGNGLTGCRAGFGRTSFSFPVKYPEISLILLTDHGLVLSEDNGESWRNLRPPRFRGRTCSAGAVCPSNKNIIIASCGWHKVRQQKLIISHDQGKHWEIAHDKGASFIKFHPQQHHIVYAGWFRSDDLGKTWKKLKYPVVNVYEKNGDIVYGKENNYIYISKDRGEHWSPLGKQPPVPLKEIAVDPDDFRRIYAASGKGFYIYENGRWELKQEESGLEKDFYGNYSFRNIAVDPKNPDILYLTRLSLSSGTPTYHLGHSDSIFVSTDKGNTWHNISNNLKNISVWSVAVDPRHNRVYIGSSHGTWYMKNSSGRQGG